jgi:hypothetical protein
MGRTTEFTEAVGLAICERLAEGESLRSICRDEDMPGLSTVFKWLSDEGNTKFVEQYAHAREAQADAHADEIVEIADEECTMIRASKHPGAKPDDEEGDVEVVFDPTAVARNRLRIDARKWVASKLRPKKYGEKLELAGDAERPLAVQLVRFSDA